MPSSDVTGIDLYWPPLRRLQRTMRCDLYYSALQVYLPEGRFVIERP
jgi:hypothetical protein